MGSEHHIGTLLGRVWKGYAWPAFLAVGWIAVAHGTAAAQHAVMHWHGLPNIGTTPSFILTESSNLEGQISFAAPSAGKLSNLFVVCESAVTGGTQTFTLRINGANTSLTCTVATGDTTCSDLVDSATYGGLDQIAMQVVGSSPGVSNPACNVTASLTNGDDSGHDALLAFAGHGTPTDGQYCGTTGIAIGGSSTPSNICAQPNESKSTLLIPAAATLTKMSVKLDVAPSSGNTETYTVRNVTSGVDSNLVVTLNDTLTQAVATCTSNCSVAAGDRLVIRFNRTGTAESRYRAIALELSGIGQIVGSRGQTWTSGLQYANRQLSFQLTSGLSTYRVERAARFQNLRVGLVDQTTGAVATATTAFSVSVCVSGSNPPSCTGTPSCTLNVGDSTCTDLAPHDVNQGDYYVVQGTSPNNLGMNVAYAFEVVDPPPPPTSTPTETPTGTPTTTPTVTSTQTSTPTDTPTTAATDTPTDTPASAPTSTPTSTRTNVPSATPTATPTTTPTETSTQTSTPTDTPMAAPTDTPTETPASAATSTPTSTRTNVPTGTPTATPTATPTLKAGCAATPVSGCRTPGKSTLQLKNQGHDEKDKLSWTWLQGEATSFNELGNPVVNGGTGYRLCIYYERTGVQSLQLGARAPAGGVCTKGKPCWKKAGSKVPKGFKYKNRDLTPDGIGGLTLTAGGMGKARVTVKGKGAHLAMPAMPLKQDNVTVQLVKSDGGVCWESVYPAPAGKDTADQFKDQIP